MQFETYRKISGIARQNAMPIIGVNGSFIAYLIGYMGVNPLPAHYYCTNCGKWECNKDYNKWGIDLPPKTCFCGHTMISMGIGIPFDCVWGKDRQKQEQDFTIRTVTSLIPFAEKIVCDTLGSDCKINLYHEILPSKTLEVLYECQNQIGINAAEIKLSELTGLNYQSLSSISTICDEFPWINAIKPLTKREISRVFSAVHSTIVGITTVESESDSVKAITKMFESDTFKKYPFIEREDIYIYLTENGVSSTDALKAYINFYSNSFSEILTKYSFKKDFYKAVNQCRNLFPRYFNAAMVYHYFLLAKYAELDNNLFDKIVKKTFKNL